VGAGESEGRGPRRGRDPEQRTREQGPFLARTARPPQPSQGGRMVRRGAPFRKGENFKISKGPEGLKI